MFEGQVAKLAGKEIFPEEDLFKVVHGHAKWGAIAMALPLACNPSSNILL